MAKRKKRRSSSLGGTKNTVSGYIKERGPAGFSARDGVRVDLTDWHGKKIGEGIRRSCWKTPRSFVSSTMCQYDVQIDGKLYTGRGAGDGMIWNGRPSVSASVRDRRGSRR